MDGAGRTARTESLNHPGGPMKRVALVLENITWSFDFAMSEALGHVCEAAGVRLMVYEACCSSLAGIAEKLPGHGIEGVVILADSIVLSDASESIRNFINLLTIPSVTIGPRFPSVPSVQSDNTTGMRMIMMHLFEQGARRIAHVSGPAENREAAERKSAYLDAMAAKGIPVQPEWLLEGLFSPMSGYHAMKRLLSLIRSGSLDAVTFANDEAASGGLRLLAAEGIEVPGDLLVTGYGNAPCSLLAFPPLTTVSNNPAELASEALSVLSAKGAMRTESQTKVKPFLMKNVSSGCAKRIDALRQLLSLFPMTELCHAEFFTGASTDEGFWEEITGKLHHYGIPSLHVVQYAWPGTIKEKGGRPETSRMLYSCSDGRLLPTGDIFPTGTLLPDKQISDSNCPLVFKEISFDNQPFGYLLISPKAAAIGHLDDIATHCIGWLSTKQQRAEQNRNRQRMVETRNQLMVVNRKLNELKVRGNLEGAVSKPESDAAYHPLPDNRYIIMLVDIDDLRHINERFGYPEGDTVLRRVEEALALCIRETDRLVRQGGDSFLLLLKQAGETTVEVMQERMLLQLDRLNSDLMKGYRIDFTWGYAFGDGKDSFESDVQRADEMLYRKKRARTVQSPR